MTLPSIRPSDPTADGWPPQTKPVATPLPYINERSSSVVSPMDPLADPAKLMVSELEELIDRCRRPEPE
jgi:hypothetical protein